MIEAVVRSCLSLFFKTSSNLHAGLIDKSPEKHGGQLVAQVLHEHGVKYIFTLVGGHISPILVSCEEIGIKVIDTRHEVNAAFAADAVARLSGVPGVVAVTAGPGLTNVITAIKNAQMAESPLILIGGAAASLLKGRGALQDIDQIALFKPICKFVATVERVKDIPVVLRKAFQIAQSGTPGPVFIEMPIDALYPYTSVVKEVVPESKAKGFSITNWYLSNYVSRLFAGAWEPQPLTPLPVDIPIATASQIKSAAALLRSAKHPVFVIGSQATLPPTPPANLQAALEKIGAPCFLGGMSRGMLGRDSPIQFRHCRKEALRDADVVILLGSVCDFRLGYGRVLSRKSKIIAVNRDRKALLQNSDMFWSPSLAIQADVGSFVVALAETLGGYSVPAEWISNLRSKDDAKAQANSKKGTEQLDFINPVKLLELLETRLPDNAILVADGGDFVGTAAYILKPRGPLQWLDPGAFGTLGVGAGFALGAKLARPDSEVWIIYGDGSCGYSIVEYDTFVRHKIPVISLVGNDACWGQIAREQIPMFNTGVACNLVHTNYHDVAAGFGCKGIKISTIDEADAALGEAQAAAANGTPVLINALLGKSNFREGSISV